MTTIDRKWKNAKCDVLAIWSHAFRKRQVFVTTDRNFHKTSKKSRLIGLGAGRIETPASAVSLLRATRMGESSSDIKTFYTKSLGISGIFAVYIYVMILEANTPKSITIPNRMTPEFKRSQCQ